MKYRLDAAHRAFFLEQGAITFQKLFTPEEAESCAASLDATVQITNRRSRYLEELSIKPLTPGRDTWRLSEDCKKWTMDRRSAEVAKELTDVTPLRLLADQRCGGNPQTWFGKIPEENSEEPWTLENQLCFQGIVCGLAICLRAPADAPPSFFGNQPGMGTYFSPKISLPVEQLLRGPDTLYLLVVYGKPISVFVHQENDPHMQALRNLGYHYGDRLKDARHPIVFR